MMDPEDDALDLVLANGSEGDTLDLVLANGSEGGMLQKMHVLDLMKTKEKIPKAHAWDRTQNNELLTSFF